ncbi:MAG: hypothetical protein J6U25_02115 [Clostridia bacterium]|nr:hypothetical protein [Clostridia bacterium]
MTLLISVLAAVLFTAIWYVSPKRKELMLSVPCFLFWGASLMWFVDAIFEFVELKEEYFIELTGEGMINDIALGVSVVALALVIWVVVLLIKDPKGVIWKKNK